MVLRVPAHGGIRGNNVAEVLAREEWNGPYLTLAAAVSVSPCFWQPNSREHLGKKLPFGCSWKPGSVVVKLIAH